MNIVGGADDAVSVDVGGKKERHFRVVPSTPGLGLRAEGPVILSVRLRVPGSEIATGTLAIVRDEGPVSENPFRLQPSAATAEDGPVSEERIWHVQVLAGEHRYMLRVLAGPALLLRVLKTGKYSPELAPEPEKTPPSTAATEVPATPQDSPPLPPDDDAPPASAGPAPPHGPTPPGKTAEAPARNAKPPEKGRDRPAPASQAPKPPARGAPAAPASAAAGAKPAAPGETEVPTALTSRRAIDIPVVVQRRAPKAQPTFALPAEAPGTTAPAAAAVPPPAVPAPAPTRFAFALKAGAHLSSGRFEGAGGGGLLGGRAWALPVVLEADADLWPSFGFYAEAGLWQLGARAAVAGSDAEFAGTTADVVLSALPAGALGVAVFVPLTARLGLRLRLGAVAARVEAKTTLAVPGTKAMEQPSRSAAAWGGTAGAGVELGAGPGRVSIEARFVALRTDLGLPGALPGQPYNMQAGDAGGLQLLAGYRYEP